MDPFNPLDKRNLGRSVAEALLDQDLRPLPAPKSRQGYPGAGVYAIYYFGNELPYPAYARLVDQNSSNQELQPIYVGKAIPKGARQAGVGVDAEPGIALFNRVRHHARSIADSHNLDTGDFQYRYLLVDDIWIPLGESLLIQKFRPIWNVLVDGFGNNAPGSGRAGQKKSRWDTIHPGRGWADRLPPNDLNATSINELIVKHLSGERVPTLSTLEALGEEEELD